MRARSCRPSCHLRISRHSMCSYVTVSVCRLCIYLVSFDTFSTLASEEFSSRNSPTLCNQLFSSFSIPCLYPRILLWLGVLGVCSHSSAMIDLWVLYQPNPDSIKILYYTYLRKPLLSVPWMPDALHDAKVRRSNRLEPLRWWIHQVFSVLCLSLLARYVLSWCFIL